jgi:hypothetical protein
VAALFAAVRFTVVAPSESARAVWAAAGRTEAVIVRAPWRVTDSATRVSLVAAEARGSREVPVRVAFIGAPEAAQGWPVFEDLAERVGRLGCFRFYRAGDGVADSGRIAAIGLDALAAHEIDLVLVVPPGPEPFSRAALVGFAAGADVVTLAGSGHAAEAVLRNGRGIVARDEAALFDLFESLRILAYVRWRAGQGAPAGAVVAEAMTAALVAETLGAEAGA